MIISYVGNRKHYFYTANYIAHTLEKLGHTVNFIQEDEIEPGSLPSRVSGSDLYLWTRSCPDRVTLDDLEAIKRQGIPTVSLHPDKYTGIQRESGLSVDAYWKTSWFFSPEGSIQSVRIFNSHGINHRYLPAGVFADDCYIAEPVEHFRHDVVFVGGGSNYSHPEWQPYRAKLVGWLADTYGDRFGKYGPPERTVRGQELNQLYSSAKIAIGDSLCKDFMDSYYFSNRQFEVTGKGGFLIAPYIAGITDCFVDRKEVVLYSFDNFVQLRNLIDYYLAHDTERQDIRVAGHERTKRDHTYVQRMAHMLKILRQEGAVE